jgi:hypothetical protein
MVSFTWRKAPDGQYKGFVNYIHHETYFYNPILNKENPDYFTI